MKKVLIFAMVPLFGAIVSCNSKEKAMGGTGKDTTGAVTDSNGNMSTAAMDTKGYTVDYSSSFTMGSNKNAETILALWKSWDNNNLDEAKNYFADSVSLFFNDGSAMMGKRDSVIAMSKPYRATLGTVHSQVHAITSLHSADKDEDWVNIWGMEYHDVNGKTDSVQLMETWRFNKQGQADLLYQYKAANMKKMK
jgi:hypothetical protein